MASALERYVIAVRRESRQEAPGNWQDLVRELSGASIGSVDSLDRIQIEADAEAIERVRVALGEFLNIEPVSLRWTQGEEQVGG